ncbi:MAG: hypothetical protein K6E72_04055 [Saccharofermentans sp.]|nr:hypothetical protein [Saccharofermentans sp.]
MFWMDKSDPYNWIEQIRYFSDPDNELTENELRDAFIHLALLYVIEFSNAKVMEDAIMKDLGPERGDRLYETIQRWSPEGIKLNKAILDEGEPSDNREIILRMCDYIEEHWFPDN